VKGWAREALIVGALASAIFFALVIALSLMI